MKPTQAESLLDTHFETLTRQGEADARQLQDLPGLSLELVALFALALNLWNLLRPVRPAQQFRNELGERLVTEAQRRRTQRAIGIHSTDPSARPLWLVPVAALGTVSLVGAYAFWRRSRQPLAKDTALAA